MNKCGSCFFFHKEPLQPVGFCVRFPPVPYPMGEGTLCIRPHVKADTPACGEHKNAVADEFVNA